MSSAANLVLQNFYWRIESITPTDTVSPKGFLRYDPHLLDADVSSGLMRGFFVTWNGSDGINDPSDIIERVSEHVFVVDVTYPISKFKHYDLQTTILKDRHDLISCLRDTSKFVGVSSTSSTASTGLWSRSLASDDLSQPSPTTWSLRQRWECVITETE